MRNSLFGAFQLGEYPELDNIVQCVSEIRTEVLTQCSRLSPQDDIVECVCFKARIDVLTQCNVCP
jgi:hypothetical protein